MLAYALNSITHTNEAELFLKIQAELITRYEVDEKLAAEMASDLIEVLSAVDSDIDIFQKYFLQ